MKKHLFLPVSLLAFSWLTACDNNNNSTTTTDSTSSAMTTTTTSGAAGSGSGMHALSESETYTDLKTGKTFKVHRDPQSGNYTSESGETLEYYMSPVTHDTFYGPTGRWVNNALIYDPNRGYSVDEERWSQMNAQSSSTYGGESGNMDTGTMMNADKTKMNENETKMKSNDGEDKLKMNENETKMKSGDAKVKSNENELKAKSSEGKVKANEHEVKIKQKTH